MSWREQVRERPFAAMGVAIGAGVLLASITRGSSRYSSRGRDADLSNISNRAASDQWVQLKALLIGLAADGIRQFIAGSAPKLKSMFAKNETSDSGADGHSATVSAD